MTRDRLNRINDFEEFIKLHIIYSGTLQKMMGTISRPSSLYTIVQNTQSLMKPTWFTKSQTLREYNLQASPVPSSYH